jgi:carboxyl-terminal processing protease
MIRMLQATGALLALLLFMGSAQEPSREDYLREVRVQLNRFGEVYRNLAFGYVDQINPEAAVEAAIRGLLDELDPYSEYFVEDAAQQLEDLSRGEYGGIGMEVGQRGAERRITVISPFEGSPSWEAGLRAGDEIRAVDSVSVVGKPLNEVVKLIKGEAGTKVRLTILRPGFDQEADYEMLRQRIAIRDVRFAGLVDETRGLGYVRLTRFSGKATTDLAQALDSLQQAGMRQLILDLRGNPGGLLREAAGVADLFLDKGLPIVTTRGRTGEVLKQINSERVPLFAGELVVLINGGSASASEIVAGSLQDHDRALILGSSSFGKGLVQSVVDLDAEAKIKLTTARYYLPSGRLIQRIDYFEGNTVLDHHADSLLADTLYATARGRAVISGRGVEPDLKTEPEQQPWVVTELWRAGHFVNYAADRAREGRLPGGGVDEVVLQDFQAYLAEAEFEYRPRGGKQLDELAVILESEAAGPEVLDALEALRDRLAAGLDQQLAAHAGEISRMLELELVEQREGRDARQELALQQDQVFLRARELLGDPQLSLYHSTLGEL